MKRQMNHAKRKICAVLAAMAVFLSCGIFEEALALDDGPYVVTNNTYYVNPDTGAADDGGDTSTGEGMCRNATYPESLYEQEGGKHYVTLRIKLISFISDIHFFVQQTKGDADSYEEVTYTVTGENTEENTRDFRFEMPASDVLIKPQFFVGPMNRDVTYFIGLDLSTAEKDEGGFTGFNQGTGNADASSTSDTTVESMAQLAEDNRKDSGTEDQGTPDGQIAESGGQTAEPEGQAADGTDQTEAGADETPDVPENGGSLTDTAAAGAESANSAGSDNADSDEVLGIQEFSPEGEMLTDEEEHQNGGNMPAILGVLIVLIAAVIAFVVFKRKKA